MCWIESGRIFFPPQFGASVMLWDLSRIPHAMAKLGQPEGLMISLVTAAEASPWEFNISHQVSLAETASKSTWDLHSHNFVAERVGPVGRHSTAFSAVLLLAIRFWSAMSPLFPLESLPQHAEVFWDSLNCLFSQDGGWDLHPAGLFPASMRRDLTPWLP